MSQNAHGVNCDPKTAKLAVIICRGVRMNAGHWRALLHPLWGGRGPASRLWGGKGPTIPLWGTANPPWSGCGEARFLHVSSTNQRTVSQIIRKGPVKPKPKRRKTNHMSGRPQLKGTILELLVRSPRKPNSAKRKCCRVRLSTGKELIAFIPKEGHTLKQHDVVLIEGKGSTDVPGVHGNVVRGKYDCAHPVKK